jgi:hypothetical protein
MRSSKDIEKIVRDGKPNVKTSNQLDKLIIDGSHSIMDESKPLSPKFSILTLLVRNKIAVSSVAAVIILAVSFFVFHSEPNDNIDIPEVTRITQSPAEMLTLRALKIAYYNGGIEAVEAQCDNAIEQLKQKPNKITTNELLADINGT